MRLEGTAVNINLYNINLNHGSPSLASKYWLANMFVANVAVGAVSGIRTHDTFESKMICKPVPIRTSGSFQSLTVGILYL